MTEPTTAASSRCTEQQLVGLPVIRRGQWDCSNPSHRVGKRVVYDGVVHRVVYGGPEQGLRLVVEKPNAELSGKESRLYSDTTVEPETTSERLCELRDEIEIMLNAIRNTAHVGAEGGE